MHYYVYPNLYYATKSFSLRDMLSWSHDFGLGTPLLLGSLLRISFVDPFVHIALLGGRENLDFMVGVAVFLKVIFGSIFFYIFLIKKGFSNYASTLGAILYAFSGQMLVRLGWSHYGTEMVFIPLLLVSLEKFLFSEKYIMIIIPFLWLSLYHPYMFFTYLCFSFVYCGFVSYVNDLEYPRSIKLCKRFLIGVFISVLLVSPVFIPNLLMLLNNPRTDVEIADKIFNLASWRIGNQKLLDTSVLRIFSNDGAGSGFHYKGFNNYLEDPIGYVGLLPLVIFSQVFITHNKKDCKIRKVSIFLLELLLGFYLFSGFRLIFNLFATDYYKTSLQFLLIPFLIICVHLLDKFSKDPTLINIPLLLTNSALLLFVLLFYEVRRSYIILSSVILNLSIVLIVIYSLFLVLLKILPAKRGILKVSILFFATYEALVYGNLTLNWRLALKFPAIENSNYFDGTKEVVDYIHNLDPSFYRIDKNYPSVFANDNLVQGYRGVTFYQSFNHPSTINYLRSVGIMDDSFENRALLTLGDHNISRTLLGVKYFINFEKKPPQDGYIFLEQVGNKYIYMNEYALPLGFFYSKYVFNSDVERIIPSELENLISEVAIVGDNLPCASHVANLHDLGVITQNYEGKMLELARSAVKNGVVENSYILISVPEGQDGLLFLPFPYDRGWKATIDGEKSKIFLINYGFMGLCVPKNSKEIEIKYDLMRSLLPISEKWW